MMQDGLPCAMLTCECEGSASDHGQSVLACPMLVSWNNIVNVRGSRGVKATLDCCVEVTGANWCSSGDLTWDECESDTNSIDHVMSKSMLQ